MNTTKIPQTDSIEELAQFWDTHDLTDFEDQLEEVTEAVFERKSVLQIRLQSKEANAVKRIARAQGVADEELVRQWVVERLAA